MMRSLPLVLVAMGPSFAAAWSASPSVAGRRGYGIRMSSAVPKELVIWDCDGCLVDSEALLKTAEVRT